MKQYSLTIGWLYPSLMSTYGDRGNILIFQKRCAWRGIITKILSIDQQTTSKELSSLDLLFGGGAQDKEQEIVMKDLMKKKRELIHLIEQNIPALFVCGAPQLFGEYYEPAIGKRIEGLGIFDMVTKHPGDNKERLIGNSIVVPNNLPFSTHIVGFENHGGRTYLGKTARPFATVIKGFGNNGTDKTEGIFYNNAIGTYLHGPLLPKNPEIADYLIKKALEIKYQKTIILKPLKPTYEDRAKTTIAKRLAITL
jgi:lipid II isoglutaminyl synthase (glutamine-hydrolysing)